MRGKYMDENQRIKLEDLKQQMQEKEKRQKLQKNVLYQECLTALNTYEIIEDEDIIKELVHLASLSGKEMHKYSDVLNLNDDDQYYIVWDELTLPVVVSSGKRIKENLDDVLAVAFETYFIDCSTQTVIGVK